MKTEYVSMIIFVMMVEVLVVLMLRQRIFHEEYEHFCQNMTSHGRDLNYVSPEN
jgi:hypothetical protein